MANIYLKLLADWFPVYAIYAIKILLKQIPVPLNMVVKEQYINLKGWQATMFYLIVTFLAFSEFIWQFLRPYTGTIPNPKKAYIFPILCILGIIFPKSLKIFFQI